MFGLADYFQLILQAGPDGRAKPYSDMFASASQQLSIPAHEILHVGDHPISDVLGAKQAGMQACWINLTNSSLRDTAQMRQLPDIEISSLTQLIYLL
jgi:putative hydrolase of the HAD superfamily